MSQNEDLILDNSWPLEARQAALDEVLTERQQAQKELERARAALLDAVHQRKQAIDALRHIAMFQAETESDAEIVLLLQECARNLLESLGEQP